MGWVQKVMDLQNEKGGSYEPPFMVQYQIKLINSTSTAPKGVF
jgi:hypothetical protein